MPRDPQYASETKRKAVEVIASYLLSEDDDITPKLAEATAQDALNALLKDGFSIVKLDSKARGVFGKGTSISGSMNRFFLVEEL